MGQLLAPAQIGTSLNAASLASAAGAGDSFDPHFSNLGVPAITWQTVFSAAPDTVTVLLEGSLDGTNWFTIDTSTSTSGEIRSVNGTYKSLRINNSAVANGAGKTLTATIVFSVRKSSQDVLPLKFIQRQFTAAEVTAIGTAPIEILPAVPGMFYVIPVWSMTKDTTGINGATGSNFILEWVTSTPIIHGTISDAFMASATITGRYHAPSTASQLIGEAAAEIGGKAIRFGRQNDLDLNNTGSQCTLRIFYYEMKSAV